MTGFFSSNFLKDNRSIRPRCHRLWILTNFVTVYIERRRKCGQLSSIDNRFHFAHYVHLCVQHCDAARRAAPSARQLL